MKNNYEIGKLKAQEEIDFTMAKYSKGPKGKTGIGALVDEVTWRKFRAHCLERGMLAGDALTVVMQQYLEAKA